MDLLYLIDRSSDSDSDGEHDKPGQQQQNDIKVPTEGAAEKGVSKKRKRGTISIMRSSDAPSHTFMRTIPHRRGHWAGHVFLPLKLFSQRSIKRSIRKFENFLKESGHSGVMVQHDALHVSISREFSLQAGNIEPFVKRLTDLVSREDSNRLLLDSSNEVLMWNDGGTRSFWGWNVQPNATLRRLVSHVNNVLKQYNQPSYYDNPKFHISVASFPGKVEAYDHAKVNDSSTDGSDASSEEGNVDHILVEEVHCRFGNNKTFIIKLRRNR